MKTVPLFTSTYSGNAVLTLDDPPNKEKPEELEEYSHSPKSIIHICAENKINPMFLVENNMSGCVLAYKKAKKNGLNLRFGLKLVMCNDMHDKSPASLASEHKIIIFAKSATKSYERLLAIYSEAATKGFYYRPRMDSKTLEKLWDRKDLLIAHPFYYSFLHRNLLYFSNCQPQYNFADNVFFIEQNDLPFNYLIEGAVNKFCNGKKLKVPVQSIYYEKTSDTDSPAPDFKSFVTYKCLRNRSTLDKPNEDHLGSSMFSFENWKKVNS